MFGKTTRVSRRVAATILGLMFVGFGSAAARGAGPATRPSGPTTAPAEFEPVRPLFDDVFPYFADEPAAPHLSFNGSYLFGSAGGYVQIPRGGKIGTSTVRGPRLEDIGLDTTNAGRFEFDYRFAQDQDLFAGGQIMRLSGSNTLPTALVSQGVHFSKGTHVNSSLDLDWYRFGYRYNFDLFTADNGVPELTLSPYLTVLIWNFDYTLDGGTAGRASRSFSHPGFQLGGVLSWRPNGGPLSFEANLASFPQISSLAQISHEELLARYDVYDYNRFRFTVHLGVAFEQQDFHDQQFLPNRIAAKLGPMLITGLQISY